jgi:putative endonuclease
LPGVLTACASHNDALSYHDLTQLWRGEHTLSQLHLIARLRTRMRRLASDVRPSPEQASHLALGARGERLAADLLERAGYRLVAANFKLPVGRNLRGAVVNAEIDLIAYDGATLCFVEVKTRRSDSFAAPEANVDLRKQRQIARAARVYRRTFGLTDEPYRYDVVSLVLPHDDLDGEETKPPRAKLLQNFWTDAKFRKRHWT